MKGEQRMSLDGIRIGFCMTGSFCTFEKAFAAAERLVQQGAKLVPIMSFNAASISTRFGTAEENIKRLETIAGRKVICTIEEAEPIGPKNHPYITASAEISPTIFITSLCGAQMTVCPAWDIFPA